MMILAAQPSTLATAVVLTAIAGGDAALAVVCTVTSQVLSVVLTPWTLALFVGRSVPVDAWALAVGLLRSVLLPVAVGQLVRWRLARWIDRRATVVAVLTESVVVSFVLMGFSSGRALLWSRPDAALAVFGSVAALHGTMLAVSTGFALLLRLDGAGRIAFTLAASQKTVAAGILVWQTGFPGNPLGPIFVVLHHLVQTVGDSILASQMQRIRIGKTRLFRLT
jgi:predicted Na+-dependent transporter